MSTSVLKALPDKLDMVHLISKDSNQVFYLSVLLQTSTYDVIIDVIQKVQNDLIMAHAVR